MKFFSLEKLSIFLRFSLMVTFVVGVFVTLFLPYIFRNWFSFYFYENKDYYKICLSIFVPSGVLALNILFNLISIMNSILQDPFVYKNSTCLKRIAFSCFGISLLFFVLLILRPTALTFVVAYIFLIAGFSCIVFSALFKRAVDYKNENDLTI